MSEILTRTLTELVGQLRLRKLSPVELMTAVLDRIAETQRDLNSFVALRDREALLADARAAEARIARGEARPLEGIPLGVKDLEHVAGLPNTLGSLIFKNRISERDEAQVARLRGAGAIVVGEGKPQNLDQIHKSPEYKNAMIARIVKKLEKDLQAKSGQ